MKRLLFILALLIPSLAAADDGTGFFFKPYVGADYQYSDVSYKDISGTPYNWGDGFTSNFNGGDIHIGARVNKYLGVEAGYFDNASSSKNATIAGLPANSSARFNGETLDALGYLPLGESQKFELIGTTGLAYTSASASGAVGANHLSLSQSEWEWRIGAGAEYWLTDNINARGLVRYQTADFSGVVDNAIVTSVGLNYQF